MSLTHSEVILNKNVGSDPLMQHQIKFSSKYVRETHHYFREQGEETLLTPCNPVGPVFRALPSGDNSHSLNAYGHSTQYLQY